MEQQQGGGVAFQAGGQGGQPAMVQQGDNSGAAAAGGAGLPGPGYPGQPSQQYLQRLYAEQALSEDLAGFWAEMKQEAEEHSENMSDFKMQALPLARIKKIMKSDEDVRMISAEAPVLFAKACECFIRELTLRSWSAAQEFKRRTMLRSDVATAVARTDIFDFLVDIVPREEANDAPSDGVASGQLPPGLPAAAGATAVQGAAPMAQQPVGGYAQQQLPPPAAAAPQQQQFMAPPPAVPQQYMPMPPPQQQPGPGGQGGSVAGQQQQPAGMPPPSMLAYNPYLAPPPFPGAYPPYAPPSMQPPPQYQQQAAVLPGMQPQQQQ